MSPATSDEAQLDQSYNVCRRTATLNSSLRYPHPSRAVTAMSYGHAGKLAAIVAGAQAGGAKKPTPPIDPALYRRDDVCPVLADRDIAALYLILKDEGVTQRQIAELTGQSQSEVSEILAGRKVLSYDLLVRIAEGLAVPRELMGLSYGKDGAYGGDEVTVPGPRRG